MILELLSIHAAYRVLPNDDSLQMNSALSDSILKLWCSPQAYQQPGRTANHFTAPQGAAEKAEALGWHRLRVLPERGLSGT